MERKAWSSERKIDRIRNHKRTISKLEKEKIIDSDKESKKVKENRNISKDKHKK